jgi:signal transduction histidine kinase
MLSSVELFSLGFACVIDTVLLLVVCERINRSQVANWLLLLIAGTWIVHVSSFFHLMLREVENTAGDWLDRGCMVLMAFGFMVLPSAMLHGAIRLNHTGSFAHPKFDSRYFYLYTPLLLVPLASVRVGWASERDFLLSVRPIDQIYMVWMLIANIVAIVLFMRVRKEILASGAETFFTRLSIAIGTTTVLALGYLLFARTTHWEVAVRLVTMLSPLIPACLFLWYILRQRLLPLVIERTFVYGGILAIVLLLHRVTISPWASALGKRSNLDFVLIEWILLFSLVMIWRPLRERVRRSLRYLLSSDVSLIRDATRQISVQLSQQMSRSPDELVEWFSTAVQERLAVEFVRVELFDSLQLSLSERDQNRANASDTEQSKSLQYISEALQQQPEGFLSRDGLSEPRVSLAMEQLNADLAFRVEFRSIHGLAMLGPRLRSDRLADEQLTALAMLCDQFAATLFNRVVEMHRLRAERQSMQQEKLAVLGLIAGSMAHEIRNPLSSIRTIITLMKEDMPLNGPHVNDVSMVVSEIDRLTQTTQRLLDYSKPSSMHIQQTIPKRVIEQLLHILEHLARQHSVTLIRKLQCDNAVVATNDATVTEIAFNLIRNAVEATSELPNGRVEIETSANAGFWELRVSDNGLGIESSIKEHIFQPFVSGKINGTGLGLFIVSERVRELSGTLECRSQVGQGSVFEVRLPLLKSFDSLGTNESKLLFPVNYSKSQKL